MPVVQLWRATLERTPAEIAALHEVLDASERSRAAMFVHERDRRRFVVARGTLRVLLGRSMGSSPSEVELRVRPGGKPVLGGSNSDGLHFNLSHCGELALFAFADCEVGVDVERVSRNDDMARVAANFFSVDEAAEFQQCVGVEQSRFFCRTWVRKEAYLKATGQGFAFDPAKMRVSDNPAGGVRLTGEDGACRVDRGYRVHDLPDIDGHIAAVAVAADNSSPSRLKQHLEHPPNGSHERAALVRLRPSIRVEWCPRRC